MKIRTKVLGGFSITVVLALILGISAIAMTSRISTASRNLHSFQQEASTFSNILNAHYTWRNNLTESILTGKEFTGSLDPTACALGSWLNSDAAKNVTDSDILSRLERVKPPHDFIHNAAESVLSIVESGDTDSAIFELTNTILPKFTEVITELTGIMSRYNELIEEKSLEIDRDETISNIVTIVLLVIVVISGVLLALLITNNINKPLLPLTAFLNKMGETGDITLTQDDLDIIGKFSLQKDEIGQLIKSASAFVGHVTNISKALELVATGDLTVDVKLLSNEDVLGLSVKQMVDNLSNTFGEIQSSTTQVSTGAKQVADGAQSLAQGSTEQAVSIEELSNSIADISERTRANADTADRTAKLSTKIKENAEKGSQQMNEMITAVHDINEASQNISKIIKTIDDIAFQTNILALNAAVEAARAGQHGKGFAVVAEEVRNLASKSAEAAKDTGNMIQNSMDKAQLGSRIAGETAESLKEIVVGINESSHLVEEIANASEEQKSAIEKINTGIDQVAQVVQQNSATAEESAAASEEMSSQSFILQDLVAQFRQKEGGGAFRKLPPVGNSKHKQLSISEQDGFKLSNDSDDYGKY